MLTSKDYRRDNWEHVTWQIVSGVYARGYVESSIIPPEDFLQWMINRYGLHSSESIRIVSDVLESNGSSSMASVCGGSLALFDAGVPMKAAVAGVAMGLIKEGAQYAILTDILGTEDHLGDMDFKVAGTTAGITSIQMDIKIEGLDLTIMEQALEQAREGRLHILGEMDKALAAPRPELSRYAPRIVTVQIPVDKIGELIGPKGKNIRGIQDETGAELSVDDDGVVTIAAVGGESMERAKQMVMAITAEPVVGDTYEGTVKTVTAAMLKQCLSCSCHKLLSGQSPMLKTNTKEPMKAPNSMEYPHSRVAAMAIPIEGNTAVARPGAMACIKARYPNEK